MAGESCHIIIGGEVNGEFICVYDDFNDIWYSIENVQKYFLCSFIWFDFICLINLFWSYPFNLNEKVSYV